MPIIYYLFASTNLPLRQNFQIKLRFLIYLILCNCTFIIDDDDLIDLSDQYL